MNKLIVFTEMKTVTDAQVVMIHSATFRDSLPIQGVFEVHDVDTSTYVDQTTGKRIVQVRCCWENESDHEDAYLLIEWKDSVLNSCIGYDGEVVSRMAWSRASDNSR